jgi:hypothetical protein
MFRRTPLASALNGGVYMTQSSATQPDSILSNPIFLAGPDRSGTSLIYSLLASHPRISMVRRTNMWRYFYKRFGDLSDPANLERCLSTMVHYKRMRHLQPDAERIRREFKQGEPTYGRLFALFHQHNAERLGKPRWGDKSLHTELHADSIFAEFPNARIIHMVRDPRDRAASMMKRYEKNRGRVGAATGRWLTSVHVGERNVAKYPDNYMVLRYETLASQPEETLRQVCAFIGEEYSPEMLSMEAVPEMRERGGNSSYGQFERAVISTRSIGRFREVLSEEEVYFIQMFAAREMKKYDYALDPLRFSLGRQLTFFAMTLPLNALRMVGWQMLQSFRMKREPVPVSKILPSLPQGEVNQAAGA